MESIWVRVPGSLHKKLEYTIVEKKIYCINNVRKLDNGGQERLPLTLGKPYEYWEKKNNQYLLTNDAAEKEEVQLGTHADDMPGEWYDACHFSDLPFTKEDIITVIGIHPLKVKNIFIYGSQVYGSAHKFSDYDIVVTAGALLPHEEKRMMVNGAKLNIHIYTPDVFADCLKKHDIMNLECVFAPDWARLQEKNILSKEINIKKLISHNLTQSYASWMGGKMKICDGNVEKGVKSVFHSLRMLMFAAQIAEYGKIVDFTVGNALYDEMMDCDEYDWDYYKEKYLPLKKELEERLKSFDKIEENVR